MKILIDTREQTPLTFDEFGLKPDSETLFAGDYTLVGHDMPSDDYSVIIERKKNCQELCGNLGTNWDRFQRELEKMSGYKIKKIIVAEPDNFMYLYNMKYTQLSPNFIYKRLAQVEAKYGVSTLFLPDKSAVSNYIFRLFKEIIDITRNDHA